MSKTLIQKISGKPSAAKPLGKPLPGYKTLGLDPNTRFYSIEHVDETEEGE